MQYHSFPTSFGKVSIEKKNGLNALHLAARSESPEAVRFLLDRKMEVNARSDSGMTGLMYAAEQGRAETVALLLRAGAIVNVESTIGCTPLMGAAFGTRKWPPVKTADDQPVRDPALAPDYLRIAERLSFHVTSII